jgi:hypothetical protein
MNKLTIPAKNIDVEYPSSWDEIGVKDAERIGEIMYLAYTGKIDYDMARKLAVDSFIGRVNKPNKPDFNEDSLNYWGNESKLADTVDFLFVRRREDGDRRPETGGRRREAGEGRPETGVETVSINPKFCTQLMPVVKVGWRKYVGPKDLLADVTIYEFKEASWRIGKYAQTLNDMYLDELFAILYRRDRQKVKSSGREQEREIENGLRVAKRVPVGVKFMIYLFFLGCMNWMRDEPVEIDGREIDFGCLFPKASANTGDKTDDDNTGMAGILFQMAESGVFGNMEETSRVSMWDVFLRLYQIHHQIKNMKSTS